MKKSKGNSGIREDRIKLVSGFFPKYGGERRVTFERSGVKIAVTSSQVRGESRDYGVKTYKGSPSGVIN
uniref:Uncharacterized protein n=1 Tax=Solanum lycopersicum TaxID=4081 RepID=A0A3Q7FST8_SOLLC